MPRPYKPEQPIDRGRLVDPAKRQGRRQIDAALRDRRQARPIGPVSGLPELGIVGDDNVGFQPKT
jgi:hypothetical protein